MKLYFLPGACSLCPHILLRETDTPFELEGIDRKTKTTRGGEDYLSVSRTGHVPALRLDDGQVLTEVSAISQYIADRKPEAGLMPPPGTMERYRLLEWLSFISTEIHKQYTPLFKPNMPEDYKPVAKDNIVKAYGIVDKHLAGKQFMVGEKFGIADAYIFVVANWARFQQMDIAQWPNLKALQERVRERPKVQDALKAEGLIKAAA
jgi:glutathione S-transferase